MYYFYVFSIYLFIYLSSVSSLQWLSAKVLQPLVQSFRTVDEFFARYNLMFLQVATPLTPGQTPAAKLAELQQMYPNAAELQQNVKQRWIVEAYLDVKGTAPREYIISRVKSMYLVNMSIYYFL